MEKLDFSRFKLPDTYASQKGKKELIAIAARKPRKDEWWMVHDSPDMMQGLTAVIFAPDFSIYIVDPALVPRLEEADYDVASLYTAITHSGSVFLLVAKIHGTDGYSETFRAAIGAADAGFVRMAANQEARQYDVFMPTSVIAPPAWPADLDFAKVMELGFKNRVIDNWNHPVLKGLRGEF